MFIHAHYDINAPVFREGGIVEYSPLSSKIHNVLGCHRDVSDLSPDYIEESGFVAQIDDLQIGLYQILQ